MIAELRRHILTSAENLSGIRQLTSPDGATAAVAVRSALRIIPLFSRELNEHSLPLFFQTFRALSAAWTLALYPNRRDEIGKSVFEAGQGVAEEHRRYTLLNSSSTVVGSAASAAAYAVEAALALANSDEAAIAASSEAAIAVSYVACSVADPSFPADARSAVQIDINAIEKGRTPAILLSSPLWLQGTPVWAMDALTARLKPILEGDNQDWKVWTNWYEDRLASRPLAESLEIAKVRIDKETWKNGPRAVNSWITRLIEESLNLRDWPTILRMVEQAPLGARFVKGDGILVIDPSGNESDIVAANDVQVLQLHDAVRRRARQFRETAIRMDNKEGWRHFGAAAQLFNDAVDRETTDIPGHICTIYETLVNLGSYLEFDQRIAEFPSPQELDALPEDARRELTELIRIAAPWIRRFPTARSLDDEAGAFLTRRELYESSSSIFDIARRSGIISENDAKLLRALIEAARRGEFQGQKAGARSIWSSRNLVTALAMFLSFEVGLINNKAAEQSAMALRGAKFYLQAETEVLRLFEGMPEDIRHALQKMIDDLKKRTEDNQVNITEAPREIIRRRRESEEDDG
jgi:hypothetical protein